MSTGQLVDRMISAEGEIFLDRIMTGKLANDEYSRVEDAAGTVGQLPVYIDDSAAVNVFQLRSKLRRMKRKHGIKMAVIDYIQLMSGMQEQKTNNREQEISTISRNLKLLAKELDMVIIALSQLSRKVEDRKGEKVPQLSDLRESGAIEQDADVVMFLYRAEDQNEMGENTRGLTHLKIAKHRSGTLETVNFQAQLWCQKFVPYDSSQAVPAELGKGSWKPVAQELFKNPNDLEL
jgi:replicative DNA helicase